jgi:hypothetical protein
MDGTARIWDTQTGETVGYLASSNRGMLFCSYTKAGDKIVTVSASGEIAFHAAGIGELLEIAEKELANARISQPSARVLNK